MDPIADMFSQLMNAQDAGKDRMTVPFSKVKMAILEVMKNNNYIKEVNQATEEKTSSAEQTKSKKILRPQTIEVILNKNNNFKIQRISRPGKRVYVSANLIPRPKSPQGRVIISTSQGLMVDNDARKKSLGGEIICEII